MRLSLLSHGYLSDSIDDAGPMTVAPRPPGDTSLHFAALCRGVAVLIVLTLTAGLTVLQESRVDPAYDASRAAEVTSR
ncbi:MAG: hypothetical protein ABSA13_10760 [Beijerinckiaceae bacterium]